LSTITPLQGKALLASHNATARINAYEGSVRSGKTVGTLIDWIKYCRQGPPGNLLMTGRTERTVINNLILPIQDMLGASRVKINRGNGTVEIAGRNVLVIGANNEQARTKIQGLTLAGAYVDECSTLPESFWNMLTSRLSVHGAQMWATCNPEGPNHWFKTQWLDRAKLWVNHQGQTIDRSDDRELYADGDPRQPIDLHRFSFILDDNAHNLDPEYVASTKAMYSGLWYKRMILGEWSLADGVIYDAYDPERHVVSELPNITRRIAVGVDYGVTNPTAGLLLALGDDQRLYFIAEWAPGPGTEAERSASLSDWTRTVGDAEYVFVDPAAAGFRRQLVADSWTNVFKASNSVLTGIGVVASLLTADRLRIHESCTHLLSELPGYVWDAKKTEKGEDAPMKLNDHFVDAARYAIVTSRSAWQDAIPLNLPKEAA
jgi:PBSX family phage terminase large subunit